MYIIVNNAEIILYLLMLLLVANFVQVHLLFIVSSEVVSKYVYKIGNVNIINFCIFSFVISNKHENEPYYTDFIE